MNIAERVAQIYREIPANVRLIAVTKQVDAQQIRQTYNQTKIRDFAENRLQSALEKKPVLQDLSDICWHFIGHLQSNKAKKVIQEFEWIHSVDNLALLQQLDKIALQNNLQRSICLQVKALSDPNKFGWTINQLQQEFAEIEKCQKSLSIRGLMTILPIGLSSEQKIAAFSTIRDLAKSLSASSTVTLDQLSMGMSGDYKEAVACSATMIRLGQAIYSL
ncbi:MAG: YggS family pyridoxal phosphate-dependent enzyme [Cyanobacteriota bacterium ELA615]